MDQNIKYLLKRVQLATETSDGIMSADDKASLLELDAWFNRNTPREIASTEISDLKSCIASKTGFIKYNFKVGDYFYGASGYKYILAHYNYFYGGYDNRAVTNTCHFAVIVDTGTTHNWNSSNTTEGAYASSAVHAYLTVDVLTTVTSDLTKLGLSLLSHQKLYSKGINSSGYNKIGSNSGCSNSWAWSTDQKICTLTEMQVYGGTVWSSSGYDTGEAREKLDVFNHFNPSQVIGNKWWWLRDVVSSTDACFVSEEGGAGCAGAGDTFSVLGLISVY